MRSLYLKFFNFSVGAISGIENSENPPTKEQELIALNLRLATRGMGAMDWPDKYAPALPIGGAIFLKGEER